MIEQMNPNYKCEPEAVVDFGLIAKSKTSAGTAITLKQTLVGTA